MKLSKATIDQLAEHLESAELEARDVLKITDAHPEMDWEDAYLVQDEIRRRKLARGAKEIGLKAGLTSRAKMKQMNVETPVFGFLVDSYFVPEGTEIKTKELIHPKVEPEIVFVMKHALRGPGCHIGAVMAATDFLLVGIEVIDSRYRDFKFDLKSVVADNCSSSRFVLSGKMVPPEGLDLRTLGVVLEKNGQVVALAAGAAVLGHPAASVAMLANQLATRGREIPAGAIILTGGITEAVPVAAGDSVTARIQELGAVSTRFV
ncbi:2-oxo-3-hexenedioate decarboxylase [Myxococcota bacterium]|nr:2-oxo-3-hexenedioate decarboxylase [Myxococcota bacterium]